MKKTNEIRDKVAANKSLIENVKEKKKKEEEDKEIAE